MKRLIYFATALLVACMGLSSCSNDEPDGANPEAVNAESKLRMVNSPEFNNFRKAYIYLLRQRSPLIEDNAVPLINDNNKQLLIEESKALLILTGNEHELAKDSKAIIMKAIEVYAEEVQFTNINN